MSLGLLFGGTLLHFTNRIKMDRPSTYIRCHKIGEQEERIRLGVNEPMPELNGETEH